MKPVAKGGVGIGTLGSSLVLLTILVIGVLFTLVKLQKEATLEPVPVLEQANVEGDAQTG
jgi:uncharacterized membrane-anchored protein